MNEVVNLALIFLWGGLLGFFYQIIAAAVQGRDKLSYVLWPLGGVLFFFATAWFLFCLDQGAVGLYGFPVMVLGFFLYLYFLRGRAAKIFSPVARLVSGLLRLPFTVVGHIVAVIILPLGWLVNRTAALLGIFGSWGQKLKPRRRKPRLTEDNNCDEVGTV